jgi:hypothetical protein
MRAMRTLRAAGLAVAGGFCLVLSGLVLMLPHTDGRASDAPLVLVPFGVAMLAGALMTGRRPPPSSAVGSPGTVRVGGADVPALVFAYSRWKQWLGLVVTAAMAAAGAGAALAGYVLVGVLAGAVFAFAAVALGLLNVVGRPAVALSAQGLHLTTPGSTTTLAWDDVETVERFSIHDAPFLGVEGREPPRREGTRWGRVLARGRHRPGQISIPLGALDADGEALAEAVERLAEEPGLRAQVPPSGGLATLADYARSL